MKTTHIVNGDNLLGKKLVSAAQKSQFPSDPLDNSPSSTEYVLFAELSGVWIGTSRCDLD